MLGNVVLSVCFKILCSRRGTHLEGSFQTVGKVFIPLARPRVAAAHKCTFHAGRCELLFDLDSGCQFPACGESGCPGKGRGTGLSPEERGEKSTTGMTEEPPQSTQDCLWGTCCGRRCYTGQQDGRGGAMGSDPWAADLRPLLAIPAQSGAPSKRASGPLGLPQGTLRGRLTRGWDSHHNVAL